MLTLSVDPGHSVGFAVHRWHDLVLVGMMVSEDWADGGLLGISRMFEPFALAVVEAIPTSGQDEKTAMVYAYTVITCRDILKIETKVISPGTWKPLQAKTPGKWRDHAQDAERLGKFAIAQYMDARF